MGPFIAGIILVIIAALLVFVFMAPAFKGIGSAVKTVFKPFDEFQSTDEKEDELVRDINRNGEK